MADEVPAADPASRRRPSKRRPIALPDIGTSPAAAPLPETQKQRAPLADVESSSKTAAKSLLTMLPSIDLGVGEEAGDDAGQRQTSKNPAAALKNVLPSLSGSISAKRDIAASGAAQQGTEGADAAVPSASVSLTGAFAAGSTGTFAPVGEELLQNVDPNDIYVDDADDSDYEGNVTETGAFAGPGYVEMPEVPRPSAARQVPVRQEQGQGRAHAPGMARRGRVVRRPFRRCGPRELGELPAKRRLSVALRARPWTAMTSSRPGRLVSATHTTGRRVPLSPRTSGRTAKKPLRRRASAVRCRRHADQSEA